MSVRTSKVRLPADFYNNVISPRIKYINYVISHCKRNRSVCILYLTIALKACGIYSRTICLGCTAGTVYNGKELDTGFAYNRFHVKKGCPCTNNVIECANNGTCADEELPYCLCLEGFTGEKCEKIVATEPPTPPITIGKVTSQIPS